LTSAIPVSDSHDALLRGAVTHRLGVAAIAAGAEGDAPSHFSAADEAFAEAKALAKGLVMTEWIDEVTQQSYDARLALLDQPDLRPSMYATCAHGCPSITQRCRYKYDHC
jgi:hypothetical protein